ncbi:MAG: GNAT family N-acetyltransferase, partial [Gemmatimonadaceae bacterium]
MDDILLRRATADDLDAVIAVIYDDPPPDVLGVAVDREQARAIGALGVRHGLEADPRRSVVAVLDGSIVGVLETMRPSEDAQISAAIMLRMLRDGVRIAGPSVLPRYARYARARARVQVERAPGSYYIAELDVHPEHRNRGIGGALLRHAEAVARADSFAQISLATTITNPARRLYERHGFAVVETRTDAAYQRITGIPGRVLMVK